MLHGKGFESTSEALKACELPHEPLRLCPGVPRRSAALGISEAHEDAGALASGRSGTESPSSASSASSSSYSRSA